MNNKPWYVYCHDCGKLLAKCCDNKVAIEVENSHRHENPHCSITVGIFDYFAKAYPNIVLESNRVFITIESGIPCLHEKPIGTQVEIRDYDTDGLDTEEEENCKTDSDGDSYQEMMFDYNELWR